MHRLVALLLTLGLAGSVAAQDSEEAEADAAQEAPDESRDQQARALFGAAEEAFAAGRFEDALRYFRESHELSGRPELLYNIGTTADRLQREEDAVEAFEQYLAARPDAENAAQVRARVEALRVEIAAEQASESDDDGTQPVSRGAGIGLLISGAVVAGLGATMLAIAIRNKNDVEGSEFPTMYADVRDDAERVPAFSAVGVTGLVLGAGLITGGLAVVARGDGEDVEVGLQPTGVVVRGRF